MVRHFDFVVVGRGMMGAAAARHLIRTGASAALVGRGEPADWKTHDGVFASHYDSGRITRTIDGDPDWALLAKRSIARYRDLEAESGITFYGETGCLITGRAGGDYITSVAAVARRHKLDAPVLDRGGLRAQFPWFDLPETSSGVFEAKGAGYIDPRKLVAAQVACFEKAGGVCVLEDVVSVTEVGDRVSVALKTGGAVTGGRVLVATGGFARDPGLLPIVPALVVKARTVVLAQLTPGQAEAYRDMPSWIDESADPSEHFYFLPPIVYPDGHSYLKIGGDPTDIEIDEESAIRDWFRGAGTPGAIVHLQRLLARSIPDLNPVRLLSAPCVTTFTEHGYPYAGFVESERIALLTGGNGMAAKSSDEIGRLGADLVVRGRMDEPDYATDFAVHFR
ncbi:FAD-dependent oxidoreductase [Shinella sp. CPCC 101442]|uniref:NAD(P)/FAD-dependent oxidoreductase n=1 Tax=Shinella sp. CPCC 101442 TaxID=2932265 RepID=UPI002152BA24|nr:FAD-dependent oxidoreductase [Shinella sp. CPCC 101442]MCR6499958.1 FAD-dependent oxidoreductase [Shinella sp. CPCC 101442]